LIEETYPSGRKVKNTLDANGVLSLVETMPSGGSYQTRANNFTYNAAGAVTSMQLGNGNWESTQFNPRLQPVQIALGTTQNATDLLKLEYGYGTTANNGNVLSQKITVPGLAHPFEQTYAYDPLNRLASATETYNSTQTWAQVFGYDRYGNRNITSGYGATSLTFNAANNRITTSGFSYDSSGNTTADPSGKTFVYDAENKQTSVANGGMTLGTYFYDGDGKRVKKTASTGDNIIFIYDAAGKLIEERDLSGNLQTSYVYAGSRLLSTETSSDTTYLTIDHLGSPRINTDGGGNVTSRKDFMAFGEEAITAERNVGVGYGIPPVRQDYTGYEKEAESGLEFAQARFQNPVHGRFTSVDPLTASATIKNPQTFNRYTYALNSPYKFTDPLGLLSQYTSGACGGGCANSYMGENSGPMTSGGVDAAFDLLLGSIGNRPTQTKQTVADPVLEAAAAVGVLCDPDFDYEAFAATLNLSETSSASSPSSASGGRTVFNINLTVPGAWKDTDYRRTIVDELGPIEEVGFLRQLKDEMMAIFADAGVELVFNNQNAANGTKNGSYNLEYREDFPHFIKLFLGKNDLGFTYPDKTGGIVSLKRSGLYIPDLAAIGVHEAAHRFLNGFAGLDRSGHGGGIMAPMLGPGIRNNRFTRDQAEYLRSLNGH